MLSVQLMRFWLSLLPQPSPQPPNKVKKSPGKKKRPRRIKAAFSFFYSAFTSSRLATAAGGVHVVAGAMHSVFFYTRNELNFTVTPQKHQQHRTTGQEEVKIQKCSKRCMARRIRTRATDQDTPLQGCIDDQWYGGCARQF